MENTGFIKLSPAFFDNEIMLVMASMPDGDSYIAFWLRLLCLAGKQNDNGCLSFCGKPMTADILASILNRPVDFVSRALELFARFGLISVSEDSFCVLGWDGMWQKPPKKRTDYFREYMREYRADKRNDSNGELAKKETEKDNLCATEDSKTTEEPVSDTTSEVVEEKTAVPSPSAVSPPLPPPCSAPYMREYDGSPKSPEPSYATYEERFYEGNALEWNGKHHRVMLTGNQLSDLLDQLGLEMFDYYIDKLDDFIYKNNAFVKNHYKTILKWVAEDTS